MATDNRKIQYGIVEDSSKVPIQGLLIVPHKEGAGLTVSYPAFMGTAYSKHGNAANSVFHQIRGKYRHPVTLEKISFREPTTAESISVFAYNFEKMESKNQKGTPYLTLGKMVYASEGVFVNPPTGSDGDVISDEGILKEYLNDADKVNGVRFVKNGIFANARDFSFVPYEAFYQGEQDIGTFTRDIKTNGLARALEYNTEEFGVAKKLDVIAQYYPNVSLHISRKAPANPRSASFDLDGTQRKLLKVGLSGTDTTHHLVGILDDSLL